MKRILKHRFFDQLPGIGCILLIAGACIECIDYVPGLLAYAWDFLYNTTCSISATTALLQTIAHH